MNSNIRTPNSELRTIFLRKNSFDETLLQLIQVGLSPQPLPSKKVLFCGERTEEIASYAAGWMAGKGMEVVVLDGANRFNPYMASSFARKALIPPESLLKRIRIARAFTCYQMAMMIMEKLPPLLIADSQKPWILLLGPITTFLDEDLPEREVRPLFERSLKKIEEMTQRGFPFLLFQPDRSSTPSFAKGGMRGLRSLQRTYLTRRLFQFADEVRRIVLDDEEPKMILEKGARMISHCERSEVILKDRFAALKLQDSSCKVL